MAGVGDDAWVKTGVAAAVITETVGLGTGKADPVFWSVGAVCGGDELANVKSPEDANRDTKPKAEEEEEASVSRYGHCQLGYDFLLNLGIPNI